MLTIAFHGSAHAGKAQALSVLHGKLGGELIADGPLVELRVQHAEGLVSAVALHGAVWDSAPRERIIGRADAIVFVADARKDRRDQVIEAWDNLSGLLATCGHPANHPTVILYTGLGQPGAGTRAELDEALQIHDFFTSETSSLRMPNPNALRFPERHTDVMAAFAAAVRGAVDGPFPIPSDAADHAMAMLDKQLAQAIAGATGASAGVAKKALRGDEAAREQIEAEMRAHVMAELMKRFEEDPAFRAQIIADVEAKLEATIVPKHLPCPTCKEPQTALQISGATGGPFGIGDAIAVDLELLSPTSDWLVRRPAPGEPLIWLTGGMCDKCNNPVWCTITIADGVIENVWPASFTRDSYRKAHIVTAGGAQYIAERLGSELRQLNSKASVLAALERL